MYKASGLSVLAYANGFTLWHYKSTDDAATQKAQSYFNEAAAVLRANDMIISDTAKLLRVKQISGSVVTVETF